SYVKNAALVPARAMRSAIARARLDLPQPTSPPMTIRSPLRTPPPSHLSTLGNPHANASDAVSPSEAASTRRTRRASGEISVGRSTGEETPVTRGMVVARPPILRMAAIGRQAVAVQRVG